MIILYFTAKVDKVSSSFLGGTRRCATSTQRVCGFHTIPHFLAPTPPKRVAGNYDENAETMLEKIRTRFIYLKTKLFLLPAESAELLVALTTNDDFGETLYGCFSRNVIHLLLLKK